MANKKDLLMEDGHGNTIQAFVPNPSKTQVPFTIATGSSWTIGAGGDLDVYLSEWTAITIRSTQILSRYFNADTTKTRTIPASTDVTIYINLAATDTITFSNASGSNATVELEGM